MDDPARFLDAPAGPYVRDVVTARGLAVAHAGHLVGAVLAVHTDGLVAVVTPRRSDAPTRSAPEVLGAVATADLRALVARDPARASDDVADHAGAPPATVGGGENAADARARLDAQSIMGEPGACGAGQDGASERTTNTE